MQIFLIIAANAIIGFIVGACGISGFLLPMFYTALTDFAVGEALALCYWAFILSGILAMVGCKDGISREKGTLGYLCVASALGAVFGVKLNSFIAPENVKKILYIVVLLAGISILVTERNRKKGRKKEERSKLLDSKAFMALFGIVTATVCSIGGSAGNILVVPLLTVLGMEVHSAMAVGLFASLFVSVPAFVGYVRGVDIGSLAGYMVIIFFAYGIATFIGRRASSKVPSVPLKMGVGIFAVLIAIYMLSTVF